ncbi:MAG: hypothetical protein AB7D28_00090 [Candidatus Berkiella sp.]
MYINTRLYKKSAELLRLPIIEHDDFWMIEIPLGNRNYFFWNRINSFSIQANVIIGIDRLLVNKILRRAQLPVTKMIKIKKEAFENKNWSLNSLKLPVNIMTAYDFAYQADTICNIGTQHNLLEHMKLVFEECEEIVIEEFDPTLKSYNVFLFKNKILSCVSLHSASIIGDGLHTIAQLMEIENDRRNALTETIDIGLLKMDLGYKENLHSLGLSLDYIPEAEEKIILTLDPSPQRGGSTQSFDMKRIHPHIAQVLTKASTVLNLECISFNISCKDISESSHTQPLFISPCCYPDLSMHETPLSGEGTAISKIMLKDLIYRHPFSYLKHIMYSLFNHNNEEQAHEITSR